MSQPIGYCEIVDSDPTTWILSCEWNVQPAGKIQSFDQSLDRGTRANQSHHFDTPGLLTTSETESCRLAGEGPSRKVPSGTVSVLKDSHLTSLLDEIRSGKLGTT